MYTPGGMNERVDYLSKEGERLEFKPHISVCQSHPGPHECAWGKDKYKKNQDWYVALNWDERDDNHSKCLGHVSLTDWDTKKIISQCAVLMGKELNLPIVLHDVTDMILLWKPEKRSSIPQREIVRRLMGE